MKSDWTAEEVVRYYRIARNKEEQIEILAQLTASDINTVIEVLRDAGVFDEKLLKKFRKCVKCGCYIPGYHRSKYCKTCGEEADRKRRSEAAKRRNKMKRSTG